jgi:putative transport protein
VKDHIRNKGDIGSMRSVRPALAGAMTVDAAVSGSCEVAQSQTPVLGVAVPYAIANVVLTVLGPIIVGLTFMG